MHLVEFNNGYENDENNLTAVFEKLEDAKKYAKKECDVYYRILSGDFELQDGIFQGSGKAILTNCNDKSITWFYSWTADFCKVENL